jgi:hypothetical protein
MREKGKTTNKFECWFWIGYTDRKEKERTICGEDAVT